MRHSYFLLSLLTAGVLVCVADSLAAGTFTAAQTSSAQTAPAHAPHAAAAQSPATAPPAQTPPAQAPGTPAPNPLLAAKTVAVVGAAGTQTTNRDIWNPNGSRASLKVEEAMRDWGRYKVVFRIEDADLVLAVTELQQDFGPEKPARLVAELKVYPGHKEPTPDTPILWADEAVEMGGRQPSAKVAEMFKDYVRKLKKR